MSGICAAEPCPVILNSTCVFYTGANLVYTGVLTNDSLQTVIQKIDNKFKNAAVGYIFNNGVVQSTSGGPVQLGGSLIQDTIITSDGFSLTVTETINAGRFATTGGTSFQFVKGDGSLDDGGVQRPGAYITDLTGDGSASGPGSAIFTLDNVSQIYAGTWGSSTQVPRFTLDTKGRITSVSHVTIDVPSSVITLIGDVTGSGNTGSATTVTLQTVNSTPLNTLTIPKIVVNGKGLITSAAAATANDIFAIIDAPSNGTLYGRKNGAWSPVVAGVGTVTNVSVTAGTGISASVSNPTTTPNITITNTAPDQIVSLTAGSGIGITGSYPSFTISNTQTSAIWGSITGTITNQTDLITYLSSNYVPKTRTLTINGTTYDLSANRTWTVDTLPSQTGNSGKWLTTNGSAASWASLPSPTIPTLQEVTDAGNQTTQTILLDGSSLVFNNNGALVGISADNIGDGRDLQLPDASGTFALSVNGYTANSAGAITIPVGTGTVTAVTASSPLSSSGGTTPNITIQQASGSQAGYLSSTDWTTFNNKLGSVPTLQSVLTAGSTLTQANTIITNNYDFSISQINTTTDYSISIGSSNLVSGKSMSLIVNPNRLSLNNQISLSTLNDYGLDYLLLDALDGNQGISIAASANGDPTGYGYSFQFRANNTPKNDLLFVGDNIVKKHTIAINAASGDFWPLTFKIPDVGDNWGTAPDLITLTPNNVSIEGTLAVTTLGGGGTQMVVADNIGTLSTQTIPTGTVTSVDLSMPSAFTVTNSPVTSSGTLTVTGAGLASQYIRGDGTLADFPTSGGGGSSVVYYLNGSVNQGTFSGNTYYQLSKTAITTSPGTDFVLNANGVIARFITDANDPGLLNIPGGNFNFEMYFSANSAGGSPSFYIEVYKYNGGFTLLGSNSIAPEGITNGTFIDSYYTSVTIPNTTLSITDRIAIVVYVNHSGRTITMHTEDTHVSEMITTFSRGLSALNGLTAQVQYFQTGTSGTDFGISSVTDTHTFNLPVASATNTGKLSSTDWSTFNGKQAAKSVNSVSINTAAGSTANTDYIYLVSGTTTITLPTAVSNTNLYTIKNVGTNTVSIATTSSQTIDGSSSPITLPVQYTSLTLISNGLNWNII